MEKLSQPFQNAIGAATPGRVFNPVCTQLWVVFFSPMPKNIRDIVLGKTKDWQN